MARPKKYKSQIAIYILCVKSDTKIYKYVGQTINLTSRLSTHKRDLKKGLHHNKFLQRVWNKYKNLDVKIYYCDDKKELTKLEQFYIDNLINVVNSAPADATNNLSLYSQAGPDNQCASKDIYKFYNLNTKETVIDTVYNLSIKINQLENKEIYNSNNRMGIYSLLNERCKTFKGWCLYKNKNNLKASISKNKLYKFKNKYTNEIVECTRANLCKKYNLNNSSIGSLINGPSKSQRKITQVKGWSIYSPQ